MYFPWALDLPEDVEMLAAQLPGRERRRDEPLIEQLERLVFELSQAVRSYLDRPFAFFGHSLGALTAFELARELRRQGMPLPCHLFVAARRAPHTDTNLPPVHRLPDDAFVRVLQQSYGALPDAIRENREVLELFVPVIRADMTMLETYRYYDEPPLDMPITVYGGISDPSTNQDGLAAWRMQTTGRFELRMLMGNHFFIQTSRDELIYDMTSRM